MIADISQIKLHSEFFAELVKAFSPIKELKDGVVYVKTNNESNWNAAVCKVKDSFANCSMRSSWLIKYDIDVLPDELYPNKESATNNLMGTESNIIMPIFLPDRMEQYYLVGSITDIEHLEPAASFMSIDAQNLIETCIPYALPAMEESNLQSVLKGIYDEKITDEWADEVKKLNESMRFCLVSRGFAVPKTLAVLGEDAVKAADEIKKASYEKKRKLIMNLPSARRKLRSEDFTIQEEGKVEFAQAFEALSEHEKVLLFKALLEESKAKSFNKILANIADRETLGKQTKYRIVFKPYDVKFKEFGFDDNYKNCMFVAEGKDLYPIKMNKSSMVIYTMSLVEKVTKNKKNLIVNVKANNKAFNEVYKFLFHDFNKEATQKRYDELFKRNKDNQNVPIRTGRLPESYNDIEASLQNTFRNLEEDYSPFLVNATTPLAINAEKIILPPELQAVKIH